MTECIVKKEEFRWSFRKKGTQVLNICTRMLLLFGFIAATGGVSTPAFANPAGGTVVGGSATITTSGATETINQTTQNAEIKWGGGFNIAKGETTKINQPNASSSEIEEVFTTSALTAINGNLSSNGRVIIMNPNGVIIGPTGNIDTAGLVATSAGLADGSFNANTTLGKLNFNQAGNPNASVINQGSITVKGAGVAALVAPNVRNDGVITAKLGKIQLGAADTFGVDLYGDGLLSLSVGQSSALSATNNGSLIADGGQVLMTAAAASSVVDSVINNTGVVQAQSLVNHDGQIVLTGEGANVTVSGTLDVSGANGGGSIKVGGDKQGTGTLAHAATTVITPTAVLNASATDNGNGGNIVVWSDNATSFQGTALAKGGANGGNGGLVETSSANYLDAEGTVDTSAANGTTGTWLLDPADIIVSDTVNNVNISISGGTSTDTADGTVTTSNITGTSLDTALANNNVVLTTCGATCATGHDTKSGPLGGSITVNDDIVASGGNNNLTLDSFNNISINNEISLHGNGSFTAYANNNITISSAGYVKTPGDGLIKIEAGQNFINNRGANALQVGSGASKYWFVYSAGPSGDVFGNLDSGNAAVWGTANAAPVSVTGDHYIFAEKPTITVSETQSFSHVYGTADTSAVAAAATTITDPTQVGVAHAYLGSSGNDYTGTVSVTSAGSAANANVNGSPYAITLSGLTALPGYTISYDATGTVTVTKLALQVLNGAIATGSSVYGAALNPGAVTFSNLANGDVVTADTVTVNTTGLLSSSNHLTAGNHIGIESVGSALSGTAAGNYTFAGATGNYNVTQLALTGTIAAGNTTYGASLVPGAITLNTVISGDNVTPGSVSINSTASNFSTSHHLDAGSYIESVSTLNGTDAGNYSFAGATNSYIVSPLALTGSIKTGSSVYGSSLKPGKASFTNVVGNDDVNAGTVTVNTTANNTSTSGHLTAGNHTGIESVSGLTGADKGNYTFANVTGDYNVSQKALIGSITTGSSTYGSNLNPGTASFTNVVGNDDVNAGTVTVNTTANNTSTSGHLTAGSHHDIESVSGLTGTDSSNYSFAKVTGDYNVSQLSLTGTIAAGSSTYGRAVTPGTVNLATIVSGDIVTPGSVSINSTASNFSTSHHLDAGSYIESVSTLNGPDAGNYSFAGATNSYTVNALALAGTIGSNSSTYGSTVAPGWVIFTNVVGNDVVTGGAITISNEKFSTSNHLDAGSYADTVGNTLGGADKGNYTFTGTTGTYTVNALALTGSITTGSSTYGSNLNPGTASFTNVVGNDDVNAGTVTVNTTANNTSTSGHLTAGSHHDIESVSGLTGTDSSNYSFAKVTGDYNVSKLALTGTIADGNTVYGASLVPGAVTLNTVISGDIVNAGTVKVHTTGNKSSSGHLIAGNHVGIESVGSTLTGKDSDNYTFGGATGDYNVSQLALIGSITTGSSTYGSSLNPGTASFTNVVSGDSVNPATTAVNTTGNTSSSGNLNAKSYSGIEYVANLGGADAGNYSFANVTGNYTVKTLALTGTLGPDSSTYGSTVAPGSVDFSNVVGKDVVSDGPATLTIPANSTSTSGHLDAGSYAETAGSTLSGTDSGNYTFGGTTGTYTVKTLALAGTLGPDSSTYGSTVAPGSVDFSNVVGKDVVSDGPATLTIPANSTSTSGHLDAGSYAETAGSTLSGTDSGNYTFGGTTGTYTVNKLALDLIATGKNKTFDGNTNDPGSTLAVDASGAIGNDQVGVNYSPVPATFSNPNIGNSKTVTFDNVVLNGADKGNYTIDLTASNVLVVKGQQNPDVTTTADITAPLNGTNITFDVLGRPIISVADIVINFYAPFEPHVTNPGSINISLKGGDNGGQGAGNSLANIEPAAGGDDDGHKKHHHGTSPSDLSNIEPAAGGNAPAKGPTNGTFACADAFLDGTGCVAQ